MEQDTTPDCDDSAPDFFPPKLTRRDGESDALFYRRKRCFRNIVARVDAGGVFFIVDVIASVGIGRNTFYNYFPIGSREREWIDSKLLDSRRRVVSNVYAKLYKSDNPQALVTLLRALATPEERAAITPSSSSSGVAIATSGPTLIATQAERDARLRDWFADYAAKAGIRDGKPRSLPIAGVEDENNEDSAAQ